MDVDTLHKEDGKGGKKKGKGKDGKDGKAGGGGGGGAAPKAKSASGGMADGPCFFCGIKRHKKADCKKFAVHKKKLEAEAKAKAKATAGGTGGAPSSSSSSSSSSDQKALVPVSPNDPAPWDFSALVLEPVGAWLKPPQQRAANETHEPESFEYRLRRPKP